MIKLKYILILTTLFLYQSVGLNAEIISGGWQDSKAYRPAPVVFLHGFASGSPEGWKVASDSLQLYYTEYFIPNPEVIKNLPKRLGRTSLYLERINFVDFEDSVNGLIDRNSSIDTYRGGDYYVLRGKRNAGDPGWSDKVNEIVNPVLNAYGTNKVIFVCHSMGGLAAREYLRNANGQAIYKVITIGTPHLGAYMASLDKGLRNIQKSGWFFPGNGWILSCLIEGLDIGLELKSQIDSDGDAARDMTPGSNFLNTLNSSGQSSSTEFFAIVGNKPGYVGDGVVTVASQEGQGVLQLKEKISIIAEHGEEPKLVAQGDPNPLLKFIDYEAPQVEITDPNPNALEEITKLKTNLKGTVKKEYLPADTYLIITIIREEDGLSKILGEDKSIKLKPSDLWNAQDPNSSVAEFDEEITFWDNGIYIIKVIAKNPAKKTSEEKTTRIKVKSDKPIITDEKPIGEIFERRPEIQARIYSPDNVDIDLASITIELDETKVLFTSNSLSNSNIIISFIPSNDLSVDDPNTSVDEGLHKVTVNAKDKNGTSAETKEWSFVIPHHTVFYPIKDLWFRYQSWVSWDLTYITCAPPIPEGTPVSRGGRPAGWARGLTQYDLTGAPVTFKKAILLVRGWSQLGDPYPVSCYVSIHPLLEEWQDSWTFDYNNPPSFGDEIARMEFISAPFIDYIYDITPLVKGWIDGTIANYGILLKLIPEQERGGFHPRDYYGVFINYYVLIIIE